MIRTYTSTEMLALWRRALGLETVRREGSSEVDEPFDMEALISGKMRRWYLNLLDTADARLLPVTDVAAQAETTAIGADGARITVPDRTRRVLAVKLQGWENAAPVLTPEEAAGRLRMLSTPYCRPGKHRPLAVGMADGVHAYPFTGNAESVTAILDPGPPAYTLDETLLDTIPCNINYFI